MKALSLIHLLFQLSAAAQQTPHTMFHIPHYNLNNNGKAGLNFPIGPDFIPVSSDNPLSAERIQRLNKNN